MGVCPAGGAGASSFTLAASAESRHDRVRVIETIALAGRIRVDFEHGALQRPERVVVHDDRDPRRLEPMALVRGVLLDGDPEARAPAAEQVAHGQDRAGEVGLGLRGARAASGVIVRGRRAAIRCSFYEEAPRRAPVSARDRRVHRDFGLGRGGRHPGRPADVRRPRRPRSDRPRRGDGPEHRGVCGGRDLLHPVPRPRRSTRSSSDFRPRAVKIGMLFDAPRIRAVAAGLERHRARNVVLDPVMVVQVRRAPAVDARRSPACARDLLPLCDLVTPNIPEAEALAGIRIRGDADRRLAAGSIAELGRPRRPHQGRPRRGGAVRDILFDGRFFTEFVAPRIPTRATHGTGCTLSAAIAANLALGRALEEAILRAIQYLRAGLARGAFPGAARSARPRPRRRESLLRRAT